MSNLDDFVPRQASYESQAWDFKPGDYVTMREDARLSMPWSKEWLDLAGPGPYRIREHGHQCNSILLERPDGTIIHWRNMRVNDQRSWIFGKFFTRNNFLGACHKAITCNPSPSEP